ncbi:hypothetical protein ACTFBY_07095 [Aeromonas dhakensis]|uniref:hypothetical protein n=1 Tax=Aeromonas TaxID=642 RepID=UPI001CC6418E|nr:MULTISPECIES: hypothetical protein [Aeromonas]USP09009.1 hypothetical protein L1S45_17805 [Aeromonas dhakensis]GJC06121.1 hypothetical protein KAM385_31500 [Aeromonas hydrophila]
MIPLIIGAITGALVVRAARQALPRIPVKKAGATLHDAAVSGLTSLEHSAARLRLRLETQTTAQEPAVSDATPGQEPGSDVRERDADQAE